MTGDLDLAPNPARPCRFCIAFWAEPATRNGWMGAPPVPEPEDCEMAHRDDPRVYALAEAMAKVFQDPQPTDAQISYFIEDADDVVDDFDPAPDAWVVESAGEFVYEDEDEDEIPVGAIDFQLRINGIDYVALSGEKERGSTVALATYRSWMEEANRG